MCHVSKGTLILNLTVYWVLIITLILAYLTLASLLPCANCFNLMWLHVSLNCPSAFAFLTLFSPVLHFASTSVLWEITNLLWSAFIWPSTFHFPVTLSSPSFSAFFLLLSPCLSFSSLQASLSSPFPLLPHFLYFSSPSLPISAFFSLCSTLPFPPLFLSFFSFLALWLPPVF